MSWHCPVNTESPSSRSRRDQGWLVVQWQDKQYMMHFSKEDCQGPHLGLKAYLRRAARTCSWRVMPKSKSQGSWLAVVSCVILGWIVFLISNELSFHLWGRLIKPHFLHIFRGFYNRLLMHFFGESDLEWALLNQTLKQKPELKNGVKWLLMSTKIS